MSNVQAPSGEFQDPTNSDDKAYFVNVSNVSPTVEDVAGGRDEDSDGYAPERTICAYADKVNMMDLGGNISEVPLSNSRVKSLRVEVQMYRIGLIRDIIAAGHIPVDVCPYAPGTSFKPDGPLVKNTENVKPCNGVEGGCKHFHDVREKRLARARARWEKMQDDKETISVSSLEKIAKYFGESKVDHSTLKSDMLEKS